MLIGGAGKRHVPIQIPEIRDPLLLVFQLAETGWPGQAPIERTDHEGYRPVAQEESERARQNRRHGEDAQNNIKVASTDTAPHLPPGIPFKRKKKWITDSGQHLSVIIGFEDVAKNPIMDALEQWHPDHLDAMKWRV